MAQLTQCIYLYLLTFIFISIHVLVCIGGGEKMSAIDLLTMKHLVMVAVDENCDNGESYAQLMKAAMVTLPPAVVNELRNDAPTSRNSRR